MNKALISLILLSLLVMVPVGSLLAATEEELEEIVSTPLELLELIETFANWLFSALIVLASGFIVWGGFEYVTAGGDDEKVNSARSKIKNALIGLIIAVAAQGLVAVLRNILET